MCSSVYIYASRRSRTRDTVKLTVCVVCVCVSAPAVQLLNGCNAMKTNSFYRLLATFLIRELAN